MPPYLFYNDCMDWNLFTGERAGTDALLLADFAKDAQGHTAQTSAAAAGYSYCFSCWAMKAAA